MEKAESSMSFSWPDPISLFADVVTIVGIPTLAVSTLKLFQYAKKAEELKVVGEDCLNFYDVTKGRGINLVPFKNVTAIPRAGDIVSLPGETNEKRKYRGGRYEVVDVEFDYREDDKSHLPVAATPLTIRINVKSLIDYSV